MDNKMNIIDYKGNQIRTISELNKNSQLVVFYPGYGYTLNAPVFFYLQELFSKKSFDILGIDYRYNENTGFLNATDEERDIWFEYDCNAIGKEVYSFSQAYSRVIYVGKSLGTTMLMNQLKSSLIQEKAEIIFLTPGTYTHETYSTIQKTKNRALIVYGNADKHYKKADIQLIKDRRDTFIKEIENAGHVFEQEGNLKQSILNLTQVIAAIDDFIDQKNPNI